MENDAHVTELSDEDVDVFLSLFFKGLPGSHRSGKSSKKRRIIYGVMSSDSCDLEKDVIVQSGIDLDIAAKHGRLKWAHKELKGPAAHIGQLIGIRKAVSGKTMKSLDPDGDYDLKKSYSLVVAEIFGEDAGLEVADTAWKTAKAYDEINKPLGFSIEGIPREKTGKRISKSSLVNVVLTPNPINLDTQVHVLKGDLLEKAMSITPIANELGDRTGGAALQTDNFTDHPKRRKEMEKKKEKKKRGFNFDSPEELDKILNENEFDDETKAKLHKALMKEIEDEEVVDEEEVLDDEKLKKKDIAALTKRLGELSKGLDNIESLLDGEDEPDPEPTYFEPFNKSLETPEPEPGGDDAELEQRLTNALGYISKGIEGGLGRSAKVDGELKTAIEKSLELTTSVVKALGDRDATIEEMGKKIEMLENGLEVVKAQPDGFLAIEDILGKPGSDLYKDMTPGELLKRADVALQKGDMTESEHNTFCNAVESRGAKEAQDIIKGLIPKVLG